MDEEKAVWEDRSIKFDIPQIYTKLRGGEVLYDVFDYIEDTKGNPNERGRIMVTNLRIIWYALFNSKLNLSIGYNCFLTMTTKTVLSKLRGTTQALYIFTSNHNSRFEFIFTNMSLSNGRHFSLIFDVYRLYQQSFLYRELKLRTSILQSKQLKILPQEQVYSTIQGIWNLSSDQGNLGTFVLTNIRLVWYADINEAFNISLPYMQIRSIRVRESKYGPALVVSTLDTAGGYVLGFRIDPPERLREVYKEMASLFAIYSSTPIFGVFYERKQEKVDREDDQLRIDNIEEIDNTKTAEINTNFTNYLADDSTSGQREPFYCKQLGFAMEKIRDGFTLKDLWEVIPSQ
ncbi:Bardet-Biedl syndrome 5 protein like [Pseudolycoriella hygida]|uniref:Bardet-Biedl syndrome 5 protein like n=1 Tax=Pseudolycoriella hygida TaxID=35572 RepID=A0A9Q0NG87_9DIPT|nr:Bardet-Biedl syndrome 5 protein like [Pseudolycoriella hygida]